ncbi:MAG: gliding motility-associated C-terminal domain-containing protein, partial [Saprospirales bacterium]
EAVLIQSPELLEVSLGEDREIAVGDSVLLEIITNVPYDSLVSIDWKGLQNPDCEDCPLVWDRPLVSTTYSVTITDRDGCMASDQMTVSVDAARDIFVPNAFSPNGDGVNDYFTVYANERNVKQVLSLKVFNRLGEQVFHRTHFPPNQPTEGWDGTFRDQPLNPGVFVWMVEVEFLDGEVVVLSGEVLVVR